jgi:hypothetical protein
LIFLAFRAELAQRECVLHDNQASYTPDFASEIDSEVEIIADRYGVSLEQAAEILRERVHAQRQCEAFVLGRIIGLLLQGNNLPVMVHALALAAGLDQLNGAHSEAEVARKLGVTRSLLSHYVVGWRDLLSGKSFEFDVLKFRKRNATRKTYAEQAKSPFLEAKARAMSKIKGVDYRQPMPPGHDGIVPNQTIDSQEKNAWKRYEPAKQRRHKLKI